MGNDNQSKARLLHAGLLHRRVRGSYYFGGGDMSKWDDYNERFCGCKDASRKNSCKGLPNCSLHEGHPERRSVFVIAAERRIIQQDIGHWDFLLKRFWNGRPKGTKNSNVIGHESGEEK